MPSFFVSNVTTDVRQVRIEGDEYHHLSRVARHRIGDEIILNSGHGLLAMARIISLENRAAWVEIVSVQAYPPIRPSFCLAFPLLQNKHDEWIVEKATELGCTAFYPFTSQRTVRKPSANSHSRFEKVALAAIKQCNNPHLPRVGQIRNLPQTLTQIRDDGWTMMVLSERRPEMWLDDVISDSARDACIIIGPEGGFSDEEFDLFDQSEIPQVRVSHLILRAETAAIAAAAQFNLLRRFS